MIVVTRGADCCQFSLVTMATAAMVVSYNRAIEGKEPSLDLRARLASVSSKFRRMMQQTNDRDLAEMVRKEGEPADLSS